MENTTINNTRLSSHFRLGEFICLHKYPDNKPTMQHVANMTYGCLMLLEPRHPTPPLHQNWLLQIKICQHTHGVFGSTNERFFQKSLYIS